LDPEVNWGAADDGQVIATIGKFLDIFARLALHDEKPMRSSIRYLNLLSDAIEELHRRRLSTALFAEHAGLARFIATSRSGYLVSDAVRSNIAKHALMCHGMTDDIRRAIESWSKTRLGKSDNTTE
jgi:hypothetical protein